MIALFFEVMPKKGQESRYLEIAGSLRPELEASGGVVYLDRFRSLTRPGAMLSHQIWRDEASLSRWRANGRHHGAQTTGRNTVFEDYRLRVGPVIAHVDEAKRLVEMSPGITYNDPVHQSERYAIVVRSAGRVFPGRDGEGWRSVYTEANFAWVASVPEKKDGMAILASATRDGCVSAAQLCLLSRDYGMFDRREAPQYFPQHR